MERESLFSDKETPLITGVKRSLHGISGPEKTDLAKILENIVTIFEKIRSRVAKSLNDENLATLAIEIDTSLQNPELRLSITKEPGKKLSRIMAKLINKKPQTDVWVFTTSGYRSATPETLASRRYNPNGTLKQAPYKLSSYMSISSFLTEFQNRLNGTITGKRT